MYNWFDHIQFHLRTQPERPAIAMEERVVTYGMLRAAIERCAQRIATLGLNDGAPVAILVANPVRHIALILALFRLGVPSLSLEHGQPGLSAIRFGAVLGDDTAKARLDPATRFFAVTDDWFSADIAAAPLPAGFADSSPICRVSMTSGTTGQPKLINVTVQEVGARLAGFTGFTWRTMLCLPGLSSSWTFMAVVAAFTAGQTLALAASPFQAVRMIELLSIDYALASTEQLLALTRVVRKTGAQLRSLRLLEVSGSVPTAALLEAAMINVCKDIYCRYGAAELGAVARAPARDVLSRPGFVGQLLPGVEVMIADRNGAPCPPGEVGVVKGRQDRRWDGIAPRADGWADVGDLGWMSAEGELYVLGRPFDGNAALGAEKMARDISPVHEVEHLLRLEWDAADAAAVLVDGEAAGARPDIWIGTVDCKDADAQKLETILRGRGLDFGVRLLPVAAIPRSATGKVQRDQLKSVLLATAGRTEGT